MGRPTKLTPETTAKLCQAIQAGATYALACKFAGIGYSTFADWVAQGEAEIERRAGLSRVVEGKQWTAAQPFVEFLEALQKAEGMAAVGWLLKIEQSANNGYWQAAAWKLERRYPQEYGRTVQTQEHELTPEQLQAMTDDELDVYIAKRAKLSSR